jgi:hypothetical protein
VAPPLADRRDTFLRWRGPLTEHKEPERLFVVVGLDVGRDLQGVLGSEAVSPQ